MVDRPYPSQACIKDDKAISHMEPPREKEDGGLETPGAVTWMQMLSRWAKHEDHTCVKIHICVW
ncbi:hypothetical protein DPMN_143601 [Dreissena polymorpha]|uniref:Uncharacterized protein n=1 Tax=Dreissena polymorpha TaxID=45954 RepID=A0A9D4GDW2_DREPO|nr:hypothetical protein DPMN_143601 [Dreissena polymorpha]